MTLVFKLIVTFIFLAHTALAAYILFRQDDDSIIENLFGAVLWTVCVMFYGTLFLINAIEDKGIRYGETLYFSPLYPFQASSGDSVYLEIDDNAYRFKLSEDSTAQTPNVICRRSYLEEGEMPYCEYVSIEVEPWVLKLLKPEHRRLQPRYVLHVQSQDVYEKPSVDYTLDPPY